MIPVLTAGTQYIVLFIKRGHKEEIQPGDEDVNFVLDV